MNENIFHDKFKRLGFLSITGNLDNEIQSILLNLEWQKSKDNNLPVFFLIIDDPFCRWTRLVCEQYCKSNHSNRNLNEDDFLGYTQTRAADFTFKDTGRVLMYAQWWNKCLRQDTFMFRRLDVCKSGPISNVNVLNLPEPKLIAMYDMLGRPVNVARENEITIYLYSDGSTRKIFK